MLLAAKGSLGWRSRPVYDVQLPESANLPAPTAIYRIDDLIDRHDYALFKGATSCWHNCSSYIRYSSLLSIFCIFTRPLYTLTKYTSTYLFLIRTTRTSTSQWFPSPLSLFWQLLPWPALSLARSQSPKTGIGKLRTGRLVAVDPAATTTSTLPYRPSRERSQV